MENNKKDKFGGWGLIKLTMKYIKQYCCLLDWVRP